MFRITESKCNKDIPFGMSREEARQYYIKLWGDFQTKFNAPVIETYKDKFILRADKAPGGLKSFGAERVIAESDKDTIVYVAPRQGHAPDAIAMIAKQYGKKCVFFMPASKIVSDHQGSLFAYNHCQMRFVKIAAMPVLNKYAKEWADIHNAHFIPFGLTGEPTVTAGLVNMCNNISKQIGHPSEIYCAVSTGTMIRALQIGWPSAKAFGLAVARNIKDGEIGEANVKSATMPFLKKINTSHIPFPTTAAYDAKAWEMFDAHGKPGSIFINVGSDEHITRNLSQVNIKNINSNRKWGDKSDLE
jgi:1-aminocyclopropane-1-carboxylate deaminase/D-cysteine desulfhydrase-like pyridoxal-dependent ACC family enzyme